MPIGLYKKATLSDGQMYCRFSVTNKRQQVAPEQILIWTSTMWGRDGVGSNPRRQINLKTLGVVFELTRALQKIRSRWDSKFVSQTLTVIAGHPWCMVCGATMWNWSVNFAVWVAEALWTTWIDVAMARNGVHWQWQWCEVALRWCMLYWRCSAEVMHVFIWNQGVLINVIWCWHYWTFWQYLPFPRAWREKRLPFQVFWQDTINPLDLSFWVN